MFNNLKQDIGKYFDGKVAFPAVLLLFLKQEFLAVLIFRYGKWVKSIRPSALSFLPKVIYYIANKIIAEIGAGVLLDIDSEIGPGFQLGHFGGIYIKAKIGSNCTIAQQVVIGYRGGFSGGGIPKIGDNVFVGAGAKIIGNITIGNNVKIGANAVVVNDLPSDCTAVGIPARIIK